MAIGIRPLVANRANMIVVSEHCTGDEVFIVFTGKGKVFERDRQLQQERGPLDPTSLRR
jgi:hypothetical protein